MAWKHDRRVPVIGIVGGIASGKSAIAALFGAEGCAVIDSDAIAHEVLQSDDVKRELRAWLGERVFHADGRVNRRAVAGEVFENAESAKRLNGLIHPGVHQKREELMSKMLTDPAVKAILWDTPLLVETGLNRECDAVVFVDLPREIRLERAKNTRGWGEGEVARRENLQIPLDKKADVADYCIDNSGDKVSSQYQVQRVLSQILAKKS